MDTKGECWKGEGLKWAIDTALQPGTHSEAQPGQGGELVVAGAPFSWKEQRDSMGIPAGVSSMKCSWDLGRTQHGCVAMVVRWLSFQAEKQSQKALPSCSLPELTFLHSLRDVVECITCNSQNWYCRISFFPEQRVHSVSSPRSRHRGDTAARSPLQGRKNKKKKVGSSSLFLPYALQLHWQNLATRAALGFHKAKQKCDSVPPTGK